MSKLITIDSLAEKPKLFHRGQKFYFICVV